METEQQDCHIIRLRQGAQEKTFRITKDEIVLGRGPKASIRIASLAVSDEHLRIRIEGSQVLLCDLGSMHGTFLDGRRIPANEEVPLNLDGYELYLGNVIAARIVPRGTQV